jgi:hypothetical protein
MLSLVCWSLPKGYYCILIWSLRLTQIVVISPNLCSLEFAFPSERVFLGGALQFLQWEFLVWVRFFFFYFTVGAFLGCTVGVAVVGWRS